MQFDVDFFVRAGKAHKESDVSGTTVQGTSPASMKPNGEGTISTYIGLYQYNTVLSVFWAAIEKLILPAGPDPDHHHSTTPASASGARQGKGACRTLQ